MSDISPLTQFIAILILAASSVCMLHVFCQDKKIGIAQILAVSILGISPYFLECISYKYDSPYMSLSILASVFPFAFLDKNLFMQKPELIQTNQKLIQVIFTDYRTYIITSIIGALIMCMTYQAASGIYPMMTVAICAKNWNEGKNVKSIKQFFLISVVCYLFAILFFRLFLMTTVNDDYVSISLPAFQKIIPTAINNVKKYFSLVNNDFSALWKIIVALNIVSFIFTMTKNSKQNKVLSVIFAIAILCVMSLLMFGLYSILSLPIFYPRAMYGFGVFLCIVCICNLSQTKNFFLVKIFCIALVYVFFSFSFIYGNALAEQKRWSDFRIQLVINDLNDLSIMTNSNTEKILEIKGGISHPPALYGTEKRNPIPKRLVPQRFSGNWYWGQYQFLHYFGLKNLKENFY